MSEGTTQQEPRAFCGLTWLDLGLGILLAAGAAAACAHGAGLLDATVLEYSHRWFQGETARTLSSITQLMGDRSSAATHPLASPLGLAYVKALERVLHWPPTTCVHVYLAKCAAGWMFVLYLLLRLLLLRRLDAVVFSLVGAVSSAAVFWFTVPETYALSSFGLLLCLAIVAMRRYRPIRDGLYLVASVTTVGFAVTNWIAGLLACLLGMGFRRTVRCSAYALCIVFFVLIAQLGVTGHSRIELPAARTAELVRNLPARMGEAVPILRTFFLYAMIMPKAVLVGDDMTQASVQAVTMSSQGLVAKVAAALWVALLAGGLYVLLSGRTHRDLKAVLGLTLIWQLGLCLLYGGETFLYALNYGPSLVVIAALSAQTRLRPVVLGAAAFLAVYGGFHNIQQFADTTADLQACERQVVLKAMESRPQGPWPRGEGHVILARPGTPVMAKAYHEPGGSLSPGAGSFGVSIWVIDTLGRLVTTSDHILLKDITQRLDTNRDGAVVAIRTTTPFYHARWWLGSEGGYHLEAKARLSQGTRIAVVIRSVGPAGGPVRDLQWASVRLLVVNNRWELRLAKSPPSYSLVQEGSNDWQTAAGTGTHLVSESGWGCARIMPRESNQFAMEVVDRGEQPQGVTPATRVVQAVATGTPSPAMPSILPTLELPDGRFASCLRAQAVHLLMGLVENDTRPGDPVSYPQAWQRDGAYILAALAGAGQVETARDLASGLAAKDFFGGFGPEADAPGLAIWALDELSVRLRDPAFDKRVWPDVEQKARMIRLMQTAQRPVRCPIQSTIVPSRSYMANLDLVCKEHAGPLIAGRMDHAIRLAYVNVVSCCGYLRAAELADRVGKHEEAGRFRQWAAPIQKAWPQASRTLPDSRDDRTYARCLWPMAVAESARPTLSEAMERRWQARRTEAGSFPDQQLRTFFDVAEAHQWLCLGRGDRAMATLEWFWDHQTSPGLYTWRQSEGESNDYHRWEHFRGWVRPECVTPHYRTAAEVLLLQLDMLGYLDETASPPTLVIGGGIPPAWLDHPMKVAGLMTRAGQVDWDWDGRAVHVRLHGRACPVRLGAAWPSGGPVRVEGASDTQPALKSTSQRHEP